MQRLSTADVEHFHQQGYLLPQMPLLPEADFTALQQRFEELRRAWQDEYQIRPEHMDVPHFYHPELFDWLCHDSVLDLVEDVLGPDIILFSSHFICKPAGNGKRVPWHEDSAYWSHYRMDPPNVMTIWLALDPSTRENGCMQVIPGSHLSADSQYHNLQDGDHSVFGTEIDPDQFDATTAVDCVLQPNHVSLHHAKTIHGSHANMSQLRRCGYTMRYLPATTHIPELGKHHIFLVRGQDRAGNQYSEPGTVLRRHSIPA